MNFTLKSYNNENTWFFSGFVYKELQEPSLVAQVVKNLSCNAGDLGSIPGLGRSPGEGKSYPLQYSALENSMDFFFIVYGVTKSHTWLSDFHFFSLFPMELASSSDSLYSVMSNLLISLSQIFL